MMMFNEIWVVEANTHDDLSRVTAWHVDNLQHALETHLSNLICQRKDCWTLMAVVKSYEEASQVAKRLRDNFCIQNNTFEKDLNQILEDYENRKV